MTQPVIGLLHKLDRERGYGHVRLLGGRRADDVFIHAKKRCAFEGTPENPQIGKELPRSQTSMEGLTPVKGSSGNATRPSYVIMLVEYGGRGAHAIAWAAIPRRQTMKDVLQYGGLASYVGTQMMIQSTANNPLENMRARLAAWSLIEGCLELILRVPRRMEGEVEEVSATRRINFDDLTVAVDDSTQLVLLLTRNDRPALRVICQRRPSP